jgi:hypothetical protein
MDNFRPEGGYRKSWAKGLLRRRDATQLRLPWNNHNGRHDKGATRLICKHASDPELSFQFYSFLDVLTRNTVRIQ